MEAGNNGGIGYEEGRLIFMHSGGGGLGGDKSWHSSCRLERSSVSTNNRPTTPACFHATEILKYRLARARSQVLGIHFASRDEDPS